MENHTDKTGENVKDQIQAESEMREDDAGDIGNEPIAETDEVAKEDQESDNFMELYEESLKSIQEGGVVTGEIVQVDKEFVLVDIGYKSEGQIPISEFVDPEGNVTAKVGDQVDVLLERRENDEGVILLSKEKAAKIKIWDEIQEIYEKGGTIEGKITARVKGGMSVDIGIQAFLPGSQVDLRPVRNLEKLIGQTLEFAVLKYNRKRRNVVLSRRVVLERQREEQKKDTLTNRTTHNSFDERK